MQHSTDNETVAVLGAGSWGTALAIELAAHQSVTLWAYTAEEVNALNADRENRRYLPGIPFPEQLRVSGDLAATIGQATEILVVVPSHAFAGVCEQIAAIRPDTPSLSWATKGFDPGTGDLLSRVAARILPHASLAALSGPTFAGEVARGLPTAITVASPSTEHASRIAAYLRNEHFRAYTTEDLIGVQTGGACKNVMAIAAGISDGLGFGANARAALITRGLSEISRLGLKFGGHMDTFMGLAGVGDLVLTCTDNQSRNRRMGLALANGKSIAQAKAEIGQEVEGVNTAREVWRKARELDVEMPITEQTYRVLFENLAPREAVHNLLARRQRSE